MKGDRVEAMVDTGQGVQTFDIVATRAGRRIEVVTSRGVVEVREVTRTGQVVRTGRFMATRLIALVERRCTSSTNVPATGSRAGWCSIQYSTPMPAGVGRASRVSGEWSLWPTTAAAATRPMTRSAATTLRGTAFELLDDHRCRPPRDPSPSIHRTF